MNAREAAERLYANGAKPGRIGKWTGDVSSYTSGDYDFYGPLRVAVGNQYVDICSPSHLVDIAANAVGYMEREIELISQHMAEAHGGPVSLEVL